MCSVTEVYGQQREQKVDKVDKRTDIAENRFGRNSRNRLSSSGSRKK